MATGPQDLQPTKEDKVLREFINLPFDTSDKHKSSEDGTHLPMYEYTRLNHDLQLTLHYTDPKNVVGWLPIPRATIFHPYNCNENANPAVSLSGLPITTVTVRCPSEAFNFLPKAVTAAYDRSVLLRTSGWDKPKKIELFFVTQNMPWMQADNVVLIRPHYKIHDSSEYDKAIREGTFKKETKCTIGLFSSVPTTLKLDGVINQERGDSIVYSSHPQGGKPPARIVASPNSIGIMQGLNFNTTYSVYTMIRTSDGHVAFTLHWLLSPEDQTAISKISLSAKSLREFILAVEALGAKSALNAENGPLMDLKRLFHIDKLDLAATKTAGAPLEKKVSKDQPPLSEAEQQAILQAMQESEKEVKKSVESKRKGDSPKELEVTLEISRLDPQLTTLKKLLTQVENLSHQLLDHPQSTSEPFQKKMETAFKLSQDISSLITIIQGKITNHAQDDVKTLKEFIENIEKQLKAYQERVQALDVFLKNPPPATKMKP